MPGIELVMRPLTSQQRPRPADTAAIIDAAVGMLTIVIVFIAPPHGTEGRLDLQCVVDDFEGVQDSWIISGAQTESNQCESIQTCDR